MSENKSDEFELTPGVSNYEETDTNAGDDAIMGTVADVPPEMPDNPPLGGEPEPEPEPEAKK